MDKISSYISKKAYFENNSNTSKLNLEFNNSYVRYLGLMKSGVSYPIPELTPYIEKYVFYENVNITNDVYLKTVSSGKVELFIHYNESYIFIVNGKKEIKLNNFITGISELSKSMKLRPVSENGCFKGISVSFSFQGVLQFFDLQIKRITNRIINLETILGENAKQLVDNISKAECNKERENILNSFFILFLNNKINGEKNLHIMHNLITGRNGSITVSDLGKHINVTCRTIHRMFREYIGIGPKDYLRIIRFNYACRLLSEYPEIDWCDIICRCGYYDQMHFIHEFKNVMKCTPMKFLKISNGNFYFNRPVVII